VYADRVAGDEHGDGSAHGGPDQAVCAYSREDAEYWQRELDRDLPPDFFGRT
jgi:MOSC domain-containing protein YiiM